MARAPAAKIVLSSDVFMSNCGIMNEYCFKWSEFNTDLSHFTRNYSAKAQVIKSRLVLSDEFQYCIKRGLSVFPGSVCDGVQCVEGIGAGDRTEATGYFLFDLEFTDSSLRGIVV